MTATRAPYPIPLSIRAEDLLIAAAVLDALADRHHHTSLHDAADRLQRCAHICWRQQHEPVGDLDGLPDEEDADE